MWNREYDYSVGELLDIVLALNNEDPNVPYQTKYIVNQDRMALFLKKIEYWRRFIREERDIGVFLGFEGGGGAIRVYLQETDFGGEELVRFIRSLDDTTCFSLVPHDERELKLDISMSGLFQPRLS